MFIRNKLKIILFCIFILCVIFITIGYWFPWTGFDAYLSSSTTREFTNNLGEKITVTEVYQKEKTLWDWMSILIIPFVITIGGYIFSQSEKKRENERLERQTNLEREISFNNICEDRLQHYLDTISELLTDKGLIESSPRDILRDVARVRTLTVLRQLDQTRKAYLLLFLLESKLINAMKPVIELSRADLMGADFYGSVIKGANLSEVYLNNANMKKADLRGTKLVGSCLIGADLRFADLSNADLTGAILREAKLDNAILKGTKITKEQIYTAESAKDVII
jgi:hypothetical protein